MRLAEIDSRVALFSVWPSFDLRVTLTVAEESDQLFIFTYVEYEDELFKYGVTKVVGDVEFVSSVLYTGITR